MGERPDSAALLDDVRAVLSRYVVFPGEHFYDVVALWVLHTHAITATDTTPRLIFKSPEKESGKTRSLEVLAQLVAEPMSTINATVAALFRLLKEKPITLLLDEADAIFGARVAKDHEDLRALLNEGFRRGAGVHRVVGEGKKMRTETFPVFAATALAAIGDLPDTIESRSIIVPMRRRAATENVAAFRMRHVTLELNVVREALAQWAEVFSSTLQDAEPLMPTGISDRAADLWEPLLAIADLAGGEWPQRARAAAEGIVAGRLAEDLSVGVRLLSDIRTVVGAGEEMSSADMVDMLNQLTESAWGGWNKDKGINQRDLAKLLKRYLIVPKNIKVRVGGETKVLKGFKLAQFDEAWMRYLRDPSATKRYLESSSKPGGGSGSSSSSSSRERGSEDDFGPSLFPETAVPPLPNPRSEYENAVADGLADSDGELDLDGQQLDELYPDAERIAAEATQ